MTDKDFSCSVLSKNYIEISSKNSSVLSKPLPNLALLFNRFNNSSPDVLNSRYFGIDQIKSSKFSQKEKFLSLFHINACSLKETFDDHVYLLKCTKKILDLIPVCETRIFKKTSLTSNVNLNNSSFESTSVESTVGGTMLYISNHLSNKPQIDLNIYKKSTGLYFY